MRNQQNVNLSQAFQRAMQAYQEGKPAEARQLARQIVEVRREFGGAHYLLGLLALDAGQGKSAADNLAQAVALDPDQTAPRLAMGRAHEVMGKTNGAILHYRSVLERDPHHAEAHARLGELMRRASKTSAAIEHCRAAIAANPRHAEALNTLGALLHEQGEHAEAKSLLHRVLGMRPDWPVALNNYGTVLRALGRPADAVTILAGAAELRDCHAATQANLAGALREAGRLTEARAVAEAATRKDSRCAEAWLELGLVRMSEDHPEGAAAAFERAVAVAPGLTQARWCLADACRLLGQPARAAKHYRKCLDLDPADRHGAALGLALVGGAPVPDRAPEAYVRQLFDDYADTFDTALVEKLDYRAPALLADALNRVLGNTHGLVVMDAGCGTGLMAPVLRGSASRLDGVDLSPAMVAKAEARGLYDDLRVGELTAALVARPALYDVVVAADVLVYLGALDGVLGATATALKPGGAFAFTVERADDIASYMLGAKSRYAHAPAYVRRMAEAAGFAVALAEPSVTRLDAGEDVPGLVMVLKKLA
jgi:predicted TPR repeat methyltransferase